MLNSQADIVYDSTLSNFDRAEGVIQQALDSGRKATIVYTYRDPVEAFTGGMLPRAMETGRTVPLGAHLSSHVKSQATIGRLIQKYAGDPRVEFTAVDNTHGKGNARMADFDALPHVEENGLRERLEDALDAEFKAGRISEAVKKRADDR